MGYWCNLKKKYIPESGSRDLYEWLCKLLNVSKCCEKGFCERIFRRGTFAGYDYNKNTLIHNKCMTYPFNDHGFYLKSGTKTEGNQKIYYITQPYLTSEECFKSWEKYLTEEQNIEKLLNSIKPFGSPRYFKSPDLGCIILGKEMSFHNPNGTNLVIIGLVEDMKDINNKLNKRKQN